MMINSILQPEKMKRYAQGTIIKIMTALILTMGVFTLALYLNNGQNVNDSGNADIFGNLQFPISCFGTPNPATLPNTIDPAQKKVSVQWNVSTTNALSYSWDFSDGASVATSNVKNPTVTYNTIGTKKAKVLVTYGVDNKSYYNCTVNVTGAFNDLNVSIPQDESPVLTMIFPPPTEYDPASGTNFTVGYGLIKGDGANVGVALKINGPLNNSPKEAIVQQVQSVDGSYSIQWDGKIDGKLAPSGSYTYTLTALSAVGMKILTAQPIQGNFTVNNTETNNSGSGIVTGGSLQGGGNNSGSGSNPGSGSGSTTGSGTSGGTSGSGYNWGNNQTGSNSGNYYYPQTSTNQQLQGAEQVQLKPAEDIITCRIVKDTLVLANNQGVGVECYLRKEAYVSALIVDNINPKQGIDPDSVIKVFLNDKKRSIGPTSVYWDGVDEYDRLIGSGEYTFVVLARRDKTYTPDYSIQPFTVVDELPLEPTPPQQITPLVQEAPKTELKESAEEPEEAKPTLPPEPPAPPVEPSKCPGVYYPSDIAGHWAEALIKEAYDRCAVRGYDDGKFRPDRPSTRFEAVKMGMALVGMPPKLGCYDADCGTPFTDLRTEYGPWLRMAWELRIVEGFDGRFYPEAGITRAEATVVAAKLLGIKPYQGCYTPECGAGYPTNLFIDVTESWLGPYLRILTEKGIIQGKVQFQFKPKDVITRAEFLKIIMAAKKNS